MLEEANDYSPEPFESFEALAKAYAENPEKFKRLKVKLIPVYKKISIASPNFFVQFKPGQLLDETGAYGFLDERSGENVQLMDQLNTLKESLNEDEDRYTYVVREKTKISDLYSVKHSSSLSLGIISAMLSSIRTGASTSTLPSRRSRSVPCFCCSGERL